MCYVLLVGLEGSPGGGTKMSKYDRTITLDVDDIYAVVNALREACACGQCLKIAQIIMEQVKEQQEVKA